MQAEEEEEAPAPRSPDASGEGGGRRIKGSAIGGDNFAFSRRQASVSHFLLGVDSTRAENEAALTRLRSLHDVRFDDKQLTKILRGAPICNFAKETSRGSRAGLRLHLASKGVGIHAQMTVKMAETV